MEKKQINLYLAWTQAQETGHFSHGSHHSFFDAGQTTMSSLRDSTTGHIP